MKDRLQTIPLLPGIYLFKNSRGTVLYIGKAKSLKKRVSSYFQKQDTDWKVHALLQETAAIDYVLTKTETEALLLEADLVKKYQPKYNVLLKSGDPFLYLLITDGPIPTLKIVRIQKEKGRYFGPFIHKQQARKVYEYLITTFRLYLCNKSIANGCLEYHIGKCAGSCLTTFDPAEYRMRLELAIDALEQNRKAFLKKIDAEIKKHTHSLSFEKARNLHEYALSIDTIFKTLESRFTTHKYAHDILIKALSTLPEQYGKTAHELQQLFDLPHPPHTIDCFDISHFQSTAIVGSCVRFTEGRPDTQGFRRFKIRTLTTQNDYAALFEIVRRRYKNPLEKPDLVLIDGGKGQRNAVVPLLHETPCISLAKREEIIFSDNYPEGFGLDETTPIGKLLIYLRNYAHHFAINYHRTLRSKGTYDDREVHNRKPRTDK
jgi:excinuclease ABC subunit C